MAVCARLRLLLLRVLCTAAAPIPAQQTDEIVSDGRRAKAYGCGLLTVSVVGLAEKNDVSFLNLVVLDSGASTAPPSAWSFLEPWP